MQVHVEAKMHAAVAWLPSPLHLYEDRYRLLVREIPLVRDSGRGELVAVFDGIGSAPQGRGAAQAMADALLHFYRSPGNHPATVTGLEEILHEGNRQIHDWGCVAGTNRPLGGCAGTVAWLQSDNLTLFHAGDTIGLLLRPGEEPRLLTVAHEAAGALTGYFGRGEALQIDVETLLVEEEDLVLLMSDGVTKAFDPVSAGRLVANLVAQSGELGRAVAELASQARQQGSTDDITVLVLEVTDADL